MKHKKLCAIITVSAAASLLCAFTVDEKSSVKDLTHPYMNTYECTRATLGDRDLLSECDHLRIILGEENSLIFIIKKKGDGEKVCRGTYMYDGESHELTADMSVLGYRYRQKTILDDGKFTISMPIMTSELVMIFEAI